MLAVGPGSDRFGLQWQLTPLAYTWARMRKGWLAQSQLAAVEVLWYFVVGVWPILYGVVYL